MIIKILISKDNGESWIESPVDPRPGALYDVAYGNGIFTAVGDINILISHDYGITWSRVLSLPTHWGLFSVTYGNGTFVAAGSSGAILTSNDNGASWISRYSDIYSSLYSIQEVAFGNNTFVAVVSSQPVVLTSSDNGITWNTIGDISHGDYYSYIWGVAFGDDIFISVGQGGKIQSSNDNGATWVNNSSGNYFNIHGFYGVSSGNNHLVSIGYEGVQLFSTDGIGWNYKKLTAPDTSWGIEYNDGIFAIFGHDGIRLSNDNLSTWSESLIMYPPPDIQDLAWGNGTIVAISSGAGSMIYTSSDNGVTWVERMTCPELLLGVAYGQGTFVVIGALGKVLISHDNGITWQEGGLAGKEIKPVGVKFNKIAYGNDTFVAVGLGGTIVTSEDKGITWKVQFCLDDTLTSLFQLRDIAFGDGYFIAVGDMGVILSSNNNGVTWNFMESNTDQRLDGITFGFKSFFAVGNLGIILQCESTSKPESTYNKTLSPIINLLLLQ